jgi:hypothetical protein
MFKPQRFNGSVASPWVGTNGYFYNSSGQPGEKLGISFLLSVGRFVTDPAEAKAYADFSLTGSIGGENKQAKQPQGGSIVGSIDEVQSYGFGDSHNEEFSKNVQDLQPFLDDLMTSFGLVPND